jgi:hypothetical protein
MGTFRLVIGTYTAPGIWDKLGIAIAKLADSAVAWYLSGHVVEQARGRWTV